MSLSGPYPTSLKEKLLKEMSLTVGLVNPNVVRYIGATIEKRNFNIFQEWTAGKNFALHVLNRF